LSRVPVAIQFAHIYNLSQSVLLPIIAGTVGNFSLFMSSLYNFGFVRMPREKPSMYFFVQPVAVRRKGVKWFLSCFKAHFFVHVFVLIALYGGRPRASLSESPLSTASLSSVSRSCVVVCGFLAARKMRLSWLLSLFLTISLVGFGVRLVYAQDEGVWEVGRMYSVFRGVEVGVRRQQRVNKGPPHALRSLGEGNGVNACASRRESRSEMGGQLEKIPHLVRNDSRLQGEVLPQRRVY
jgi:hypothetical protein